MKIILVLNLMKNIIYDQVGPAYKQDPFYDSKIDNGLNS